MSDTRKDSYILEYFFRLCHKSRSFKDTQKQFIVEGTVAQAMRTCEMRQARYIGSQKLQLQAFFTATAMNVLRAVAWLKGNRPASTPISRFARLVASAQFAAAA